MVNIKVNAYLINLTGMAPWISITPPTTSTSMEIGLLVRSLMVLFSIRTEIPSRDCSGMAEDITERLPLQMGVTF